MRKALPFFLATALVLGLTAPVDAQRGKRRVSERQLKRDLAKLRDKKASLRSQLRKTRREAKVVLGDIERVDNRLVDVQHDLHSTTERLGTSRSRQRQVGQELQQAQAKLEETKVQVRKRLKRMYMQGKPSYLSVIAGAKSVTDVASRQFMFELIAKKDRKVFDQYKQLCAEVEERKREADRLVAEISDLAYRQRVYHANLTEARKEKKEYLSELREKQEDLEATLAQFEADERQIANQIAAFYRRRGGKSNLPAFTGRFSRPTAGRVTSSFGMRFHPILKRSRLHAGVDFGGGYGAPVWAAADGQVIAAQYMRGYGNVIIIDHGGGVTTVYAHLSRFAVGSGRSVKRGQRIGSIGATGLATGPHLHWEVRINGRAVNPMGR